MTEPKSDKPNTAPDVKELASAIVGYCKNGDQSTPIAELCRWTAELIQQAIAEATEGVMKDCQTFETMLKEAREESAHFYLEVVRLTAENEQLKRCVDEQYKTLAEIKDTLTEYPTTSQEESTAVAVKKLCAENDRLNKMVGELEETQNIPMSLNSGYVKWETVKSIIEKYKESYGKI